VGAFGDGRDAGQVVACPIDMLPFGQRTECRHEPVRVVNERSGHKPALSRADGQSRLDEQQHVRATGEPREHPDPATGSCGSITEGKEAPRAPTGVAQLHLLPRIHSKVNPLLQGIVIHRIRPQKRNDQAGPARGK